MNIDLDDRAWFDAIAPGGIGVHVVEGRKLWVQNRTIYGPPPLWVVISEQRCETFRPICNRIGPNFGQPDHRGCPDCLGSGRPLVQATVPCIACSATGAVARYPRPDEADMMLQGCDRCTMGRVPIGFVTVEAAPVPIVHFIDWDTSRSAIVIDDMGHAIYFRVDGDMVDAGVRVNLGPNPEQYVGKFGVIVRRVS